MNNPMTYIQNGDYLIPDLKLSQQRSKPLSKYGRMRKTYLKEHRPILYNQMLLSEKPVSYTHLDVYKRQGCVRVTGLYSEKTGKTYDATVVLEDDEQYANFKLEFDQRKGGSR